MEVEGIRCLTSVSTAVSLLIADQIFRAYERSSGSAARDGSVFDLAGRMYNDSEGFVASQKRESEYRILNLGDSFAVGTTLPEYTVAAVIARDLTRTNPSRPVRVVNLSRPKTSYDDYLREYRRWSRKLEFDAALFNLYAGNDFFEAPRHQNLGDAWLETPRATGSQGGESVVEMTPQVVVPHAFPLRILDYAYATYMSLRYAAPDSEKYEGQRISQKNFLRQIGVVAHRIGRAV